MSLQLMIIASETSLAEESQAAGVDRIFFDLEVINKYERQRGLNTVITTNRLEDLPRFRDAVRSAQLLVRTNPIHKYIEQEIEAVLRGGADILMLPMAVEKSDVETFVKIIGGRARTSVMIENARALARIDAILEVGGIDELFIGLNDLYLSLNLDFMFETLSCGLVEYLAGKIRKKGIPFGFGGIARIGDGLLPAEAILGEHYRLGSTSVILSRTFKGDFDGESGRRIDLKDEVRKIRVKEDEIRAWPSDRYEANRRFVVDTVQKIIGLRNAKKAEPGKA